jgi:hypothetical protein
LIGLIAILGFGYEIKDRVWWLSNLPLCDLVRLWDHWSRRLEPQTMPTLSGAVSGAAAREAPSVLPGQGGDRQ